MPPIGNVVPDVIGPVSREGVERGEGRFFVFETVFPKLRNILLDRAGTRIQNDAAFGRVGCREQGLGVHRLTKKSVDVPDGILISIQTWSTTNLVNVAIEIKAGSMRVA